MVVWYKRENERTSIAIFQPSLLSEFSAFVGATGCAGHITGKEDCDCEQLSVTSCVGCRLSSNVGDPWLPVLVFRLHRFRV